MSSSDREREQELADLLREVRALRETLEELKSGTELRPRLPPDYAVLVRSQPVLPPDYAVAVRPQFRPPPEYQVLVRTQAGFEPPSYEVLVRPAGPESEGGPVDQ